MTSHIRSPHDTFFQAMLEELEVANSFLRARLPHRIRQEIDGNSLTIADTARRSAHRKPLYTDITYHAFTKKNRGHIYLHVEQERSIDATMLERILQYNVGLFLKHRKQGYRKLAPYREPSSLQWDSERLSIS